MLSHKNNYWFDENINLFSAETSSTYVASAWMLLLQNKSALFTVSLHYLRSIHRQGAHQNQLFLSNSSGGEAGEFIIYPLHEIYNKINPEDRC